MLLYMFEDSADHDHKLVVDKKAVPENAKSLCWESGQWQFQKQLEEVTEKDSLVVIGPVKRVAEDIKKQGYHEAEIIWKITTSVRSH